MTIDLSSYNSVQTGLFVSIDVDGTNIFRFSDYNATINISGYNYTGLGKFVAITQTTSELKSSNGSVTITLTGIPNTSISEVTSLKFKGAKVIVQRVFFNAVTGDILNISGNPVGRFFGVVNNYSLAEEYDVATRTSSNTIVLVCSSLTELLTNKIAGRKTNPSSFRSFNSNDSSMDHVPGLVGANFDFGKPKK
jgi:hypothetical protein